MISGNDWLQIAVYMAVLLACAAPLGAYMAKVYSGERVFLTPVLGWLERSSYKLCGVDPAQEMGWRRYAMVTVLFSLINTLLLYAMLRLQGVLGFNPEGLPANSPDLAFNTAVSFLTNTNWQSYSGEQAMSYLTQMAGLTVQNFLSAAVGMAVAVALVRGFARKKASTIGNFWVDLVRGTVYILLPLALVFALILGSQGVVQTFGAHANAPLMETITVPEQKDSTGKVTQAAQTVTEQAISVGPVASQEAIKMLGTNGGGFYNANSAHPFENPTPLTDFLELLAILLIPAALCCTFGTMVGDKRQGWTLLIAMTIIFVPIMLACVHYEAAGNSLFDKLHIAPGGNMEGKEARFGVANSALWASATTAASNGSVNAMHDSFMPLGGLIPMVMMQFGEVIYGGVGSGLYGMLVFVVITVFIAGLMVGRTPEYLGKKIGAFDIKMASIGMLATPMAALVGAAIAVSCAAGQAGTENPGAQGFGEMLYAFTSAANNNGSAFAGLSANTVFYNTALGITILFGRYMILIAVLALAGSLAAKNAVPPSAGTLPTHTPLFIGTLVATVVMVALLTFVPALALGPVAEHFNLMQLAGK